MNKMFNSVVVCTKDRYQDIHKFLYSLIHQTEKPDELLIIDASKYEKNIEACINNIVSNYIDSVKYYKTKANLAYQKNFALSKLDERCKIVSFFDDDVVLDRNYLGAVMEAFQDPDNIGIVGITGKNCSAPKVRMKFIKKMFFLYSSGKGKILPSGFNVRNIDDFNMPVLVDWIPGGMSSYRRWIFGDYTFDEWFSLNDDIDFSYRVSRHHKFLFIPNAVLEHKQSGVSRNSERHIGYKQITERYYLVTKNMGRFINKCLFFWSALGILLINLLVGFLRPKILKSRIQRLWGNIQGIAYCIFQGRSICCDV